MTPKQKEPARNRRKITIRATLLRPEMPKAMQTQTKHGEDN
jgi:hypothetical protein